MAGSNMIPTYRRSNPTKTGMANLMAVAVFALEPKIQKSPGVLDLFTYDFRFLV